MTRVLSIAREEIRRAWREHTLQAVLLVVAVLFGTASEVGVLRHRELEVRRQKCQEIVRQQFVDQPDRHPHRVSHYGYFAFRPPSPLSLLDVGVDSYVGSSIYLEAHLQNSANFSASRESGNMLRFGELTVGLVLQLLAPLLIFFLCHHAITREREAGTLSMLLCQGLSYRGLILGKVLGLVGLFLGMVIPAMLFAGAYALAGTGSGIDAGGAIRLGLLGLAYSCYLTLWVMLAVLVSAACQSSRSSLLILLSLWVALFVLVPRALYNVADRLYPSPTKPEFDAMIHKRILEGGDGHNPQDVRFAALKQATLDKYKVKTVEELPVNFAGIAMREAEDYSSKVYQECFTGLQEIYARQNRVSELAGVLDPYLAMRSLSMALSSTDFHHFVAFQRSAEAYRYDLIQGLNNLHVEEIKFKGDKDQRLHHDHWKSFPPYHFEAPTLRVALARHWTAPTALFLWLGVLVVMMVRIPDVPREESR